MSDLKTKMHQIRFRLGSTPDPTGGTYSSPHTPIDLMGPTSKWRGGEGGEGREGKEMDAHLLLNSWMKRHCCQTHDTQT